MLSKFIKTGISLFVGATLFASAGVMAMAYEEEVDYSVVFNGEKLVFDQDPINVNDRVLVPMRGIFEAYGADVEWDEVNRIVTATAGDTVIELTIDADRAYINGERCVLDVPAMIVEETGRTMVPVRFVSEALKADVDWDETTYTVIINAVKEEEEPPVEVPDEPENAIFGDIDDIDYEEGFFSTQEGIKGSCYLTCLGMIASNLNDEEIYASHVYRLNENSVEQHNWKGLLEKLNIVRTDYYDLKGSSSKYKIQIVTELLRDNPEGVIVRFLNGGSSHYIVCKGFENGKIIASDPVGQICVPIDDTWVGYSMFDGYNAAIEGMVLAEAYKIGDGSFSWDFLDEGQEDLEGEEAE